MGLWGMLGARHVNISLMMIVTALVLFICLFSPVSAQATTTLSPLSFNLPQSETQHPTAAVQHANGRYYVCDAIKKHVSVLDANHKSLFTFKELLDMPIDIALSDNDVFVLDETSHTILIYDFNGNYKSTLGSQGLAAGQFHQPSAIFYDAGLLYVADTGNNRIQIFDASTFELNSIFAIDENGTDLDAPTGLAVLGDTLYVVESTGAKINAYDKSSGALLSPSLARASDRNTDITVDDDMIILSSPTNKQISFYSADLALQKTIDLPARVYQLSIALSHHILASGCTSRTTDGLLYDIAPNGFITTIPNARVGISSPQAIATDENGNFYVADTGNNRVLVFNGDHQLKSTLTEISSPVDLEVMDDKLYVLDNLTPALLIYDTNGQLTRQIDLSFMAHPTRFALVDSTHALICDSSDLYLIDFLGTDVSYETLNRDLIKTPLDVALHDGMIYLLNSVNGDLLLMPLSENTVLPVSLSAAGVAPLNATSIAVNEASKIYIADALQNKIFCYNPDFTLNQRILTDDSGFSGPTQLFASNGDFLVCFSAQAAFAKLVTQVQISDYYITLDDKKLKNFEKDITVYSTKAGASETYVDIDCIATDDFSVKGDIGRYLLFYGLNTFDVAVDDGTKKAVYTLYVTREYPEGFTVDDIDDYISYTQTKDIQSVPTSPIINTAQALLLDIDGLNLDKLKITSLSKEAQATVVDGKIKIVVKSTDSDNPPVLQLATAEGLVILSANDLNQYIVNKRNQFLLYVIIAGASGLLIVYFFIDYLKKHPAKRHYKKAKK